jgi:hypothetical protein
MSWFVGSFAMYAYGNPVFCFLLPLGIFSYCIDVFEFLLRCFEYFVACNSVAVSARSSKIVGVVVLVPTPRQDVIHLFRYPEAICAYIAVSFEYGCSFFICQLPFLVRSGSRAALV